MTIDNRQSVRTGYILEDTKNEIMCSKCRAKPGRDCITPGGRKADIHDVRCHAYEQKILIEAQGGISEDSVEDLFDKIFNSVPMGGELR